MSTSTPIFFEICRKKSEKDGLKIKLSELKEQENQLEDKLKLLQCELEKENKDVERLEKVTLSTIIYTIINKKVDLIQDSLALWFFVFLLYTWQIHSVVLENGSVD